MSISSLQFVSYQINKNKFEILYQESMEWFKEENISSHSLLDTYFREYLGYKYKKEKVEMPDGSIFNDIVGFENSEVFDLDIDRVESLLSEIPEASLNLIEFVTTFPFDYTKECLSTLKLLNDKGVALIYIPVTLFKEISRDLKKHKFYVNGIFGDDDQRQATNETDKKHILPLYCKCIALYVSRVETKHLFIWAEINDSTDLISSHDCYEVHPETLNKVLTNSSKVTKKDIIYQQIMSYQPIVFSRSKFHGLEHLYYSSKSILINKSRYPNIREVKLSEVMELVTASSYEISKNLDIILIIDTIKTDNVPVSIEVYHPSERTPSDYKSMLAIPEERQEVALQITDHGSNPIVRLDFLLHFLRSEEGSLQTKLVLLNSKKPFEAWKKIKIPLPSIKEQESLVSALDKTKNIKSRIKQLETNLFTDPLNAQETDNELKEMITRLEMLSESEQILQLVNRRGNETDQIEFKQTLRLDINTQTSEIRLETTALKTIVGFINNNGGHLIIGVSDDGQISGMENELLKFHKKSHDKFKIFFGDKVGQRIGKEFLNNISYEFIAVSGKYVFQVKCTKSKSKCFLDGKDYYVRRHAYTEKLSGPEMAKYFEEHYDPKNW